MVHPSLSSSPSLILLPLDFSVLHLSAFSHFLILRTFWLPETAAVPPSSVIIVISTELLERYVMSIFSLITPLQDLIGGVFVKTHPVYILCSASYYDAFIQFQQCLFLFILYPHLHFHWFPRSHGGPYSSPPSCPPFIEHMTHALIQWENREQNRGRALSSSLHVIASGLGSCRCQRNRNSNLDCEYCLKLHYHSRFLHYKTSRLSHEKAWKWS